MASEPSRSREVGNRMSRASIRVMVVGTGARGWGLVGLHRGEAAVNGQCAACDERGFRGHQAERGPRALAIGTPVPQDAHHNGESVCATSPVLLAVKRITPPLACRIMIGMA